MIIQWPPNIIWCLYDLFKRSPIHYFSINEQKLTKIDEATLDNMAKYISSYDINDVLCCVYTDGRISDWGVFSVYAFTAYCTIQHADETKVILRLFDNFYLNALEPWFEKNAV